MNTHSHNNNHSRAFAVGIALNLVFVVIEVVYGKLSNSSALLADAGHNAGDIMALIFAWAAAWMHTIKPKGKYTYGLRKTTILVSILNALILFVAVGFIAADAIQKLSNPLPVGGTQVIVVAAIGIIINLFTALLFMKGQKDDLNIRGAFLHMAADAGVSLGVVVGGVIIVATGIVWIDPIISFLIIGVILWGTWKLFIESLDLALDAVPRSINIDEVRKEILSIEGVIDLHDLHIWAMSTTRIALTAHIDVEEGSSPNILNKIRSHLKEKFYISHTTLQIETFNTAYRCDVDC